MLPLEKLPTYKFLYENYDKSLGITARYRHLSPQEIIRQFCIGYTDSEDIPVPPGCGQVTLMFEEPDGTKTWFHYPKRTLENWSEWKLINKKE